MGVFEDIVQQSSRKRDSFGGVLERRREKRTPMLRASQGSMTSSLWELEMIPAFGLTRLLDDIHDLNTRATDSNIFFEPDILHAAWPRLTSLLAQEGCWMLCLWESVDTRRILKFFAPVHVAKTGLPRHRVLQILSNEYMPIGTPLIDTASAGETCETLLRLLSDPALGMPSVFDIMHLRQDSKANSVLQEAASSLGLPFRECCTFKRAALLASKDPKATIAGLLGPKRRRELRRQMKLLKAKGEVSFSIAKSEDQALDAFEEFITLELKGWKGRRGTALYNHKRIAAFSRQIVAHLAARNACQFHSIYLDGKIVATLIMFERNGRLIPWKMAFDEAYAAYSPGMQTMLFATKNLLSRKTFIEADSLAQNNHWMMNRIWPDRIAITNLLIGLKSDTLEELEGACRAKYNRQMLKNLWNKWVGKLRLR